MSCLCVPVVTWHYTLLDESLHANMKHGRDAWMVASNKKKKVQSVVEVQAEPVHEVQAKPVPEVQAETASETALATPLKPSTPLGESPLGELSVASSSNPSPVPLSPSTYLLPYSPNAYSPNGQWWSN